MIKAILFDADGVLIHSETTSVELERKYGIAQSLSKEFFTKEWEDILIGKEDTREKLAPYLKSWGWKGSVEDYQDFWFNFEHKLDQQLVDRIQELRQGGILCFVATNQDKYRAEYMLKKMKFEDSFDDLFASAHLGKKKPDQDFFTTILSKLNLKPEEVFFWDDSIENVEAAKELGMNAELYTDYDSFNTVVKTIVESNK